MDHLFDKQVDQPSPAIETNRDNIHITVERGSKKGR